MNRELLAAIQDGKPWLDRFTRLDYAGAFAEYTRRFGPLYRAALRETGEEALAEALLDALAEGRKTERFWNRSTRAFDEKRMVVSYLSPMLIGQGDQALAEALRDAWARRWPRDAYQTAPYEKLRGSFRNTFLGFTLSDQDDGDD